MQTKEDEVVNPAFVGEVEKVLVYFTVPGNQRKLVPDFIKKASFPNTPKNAREKAKRSDLLFRSEQIRMDYVLADLASASFFPSDVFYLDRDGGARRVRITCDRFGTPLPKEQIMALGQILVERIWDVESFRTSSTANLPWEHISIVAGRPDYAPEGGLEAVRVTDGDVCLRPTQAGEDIREFASNALGSLRGILANLE